MLRRMQALARIQARACANRAHMSDTGNSRSNYYQSRNPRPRKTKDTAYLQTTPSSSNWLDQWIEVQSWNSQGCTPQETGYADDKILEVDTWKPHLYSAPKRNYNYQSVTKSEKRKNPSISSGEASSIRSLKFPTGVDRAAAWTSENGPLECCASSRPKCTVRKRSHLSPARSNCSRSFFGDSSAYPNYMANTESSLARVRSHSVPKQRMPVIEKVGSTKRFVRGFWDADTISEMGSTMSYGGRF